MIDRGISCDDEDVPELQSFKKPGLLSTTSVVSVLCAAKAGRGDLPDRAFRSQSADRGSSAISQAHQLGKLRPPRYSCRAGPLCEAQIVCEDAIGLLARAPKKNLPVEASE